MLLDIGNTLTSMFKHVIQHEFKTLHQYMHLSVLLGIITYEHDVFL